MGFCLSHTSKIKLLDILGDHFADIAIDQVRLGNKLQGTGDNWDMKIRPHNMLSMHQNTDLHYFASNLIVVQNVTTERPTFVAKLSISPKYGGSYKAEGGFQSIGGTSSCNKHTTIVVSQKHRPPTYSA